MTLCHLSPFPMALSPDIVLSPKNGAKLPHKKIQSRMVKPKGQNKDMLRKLSK